MKPWLERKKNLGFYETFLAELPEDEYNNKNYLRMTSKNFEKMFQLTLKDNLTKENTKMRDSNPLKL